MSKNTKNYHCIKSISIPNVKILRYNYFCFVQKWKHYNYSNPFWHFWYNPQELSSFFCDGKEYFLEPNTVMLLPPNTVISTKCEYIYSQFYIHFKIEEPFMAIKRAPIAVSAKNIFGENPINFVDEVDNFRENRRKLALFLYELVLKSLTLIPEENYVEDEHVVDQRVLDSIKYINEHLKYSPDNIEICKHIGMSTNNFLRLFKKEMLISPQQYMLNQRLEKGRILLLEMPLISLDEIAEATGFADRYHFSKLFRQKIQMSPIEYRKKIMHLNSFIK